MKRKVPKDAIEREPSPFWAPDVNDREAVLAWRLAQEANMVSLRLPCLFHKDCQDETHELRWRTSREEAEQLVSERGGRVLTEVPAGAVAG